MVPLRAFTLGLKLGQFEIYRGMHGRRFPNITVSVTGPLLLLLLAGGLLTGLRPELLACFGIEQLCKQL